MTGSRWEEVRGRDDHHHLSASASSSSSPWLLLTLPGTGFGERMWPDSGLRHNRETSSRGASTDTVLALEGRPVRNGSRFPVTLKVVPVPWWQKRNVKNTGLGCPAVKNNKCQHCLRQEELVCPRTCPEGPHWGSENLLWLCWAAPFSEQNGQAVPPCSSLSSVWP